MKVEILLDIIGADFYTGVPDSQLKALCNYLMDQYGISSKHHLIAANEGNCVALAAGYHLATGKLPVVYMQNSGEGNIINPVASLLHKKVYGIPMVFIIGWRGEPGIHDEPQHVFQGEITMSLLKDMGIASCVIGKETTVAEVRKAMNDFRTTLKDGGNVAFVIKKSALSYDKPINYGNKALMDREDIIRHIVAEAKQDIIISTTGKASRELFEIREENNSGHQHDFLTVGSMGHTSSIALGVAIHQPEKKIWCIDGDGAVLMHMGAMAVIGAVAPENMIHIVINNAAHETVGGMPTVAGQIDLAGIARACGYPYATSVKDFEMLDHELKNASSRGQLSFIEVQCSIGSREDLGRPTTSAQENKEKFMEYLRTEKNI